MEGYKKFIAFLKGLEAGFEIEIEGRTYAMGYDNSGNPRIAHKVHSTDSNGKESYVYMQGLDLPDVNNFMISIMKDLSDDQITEINANIVLNKIKNETTD